MHGGPLFYQGPCPPDASILTIEGLCQNNMSKGSMKLVSSDARQLPIIDIAYLSHLYDLQVAIETVREIVRLAKTESFSTIIESVLLGPGIREHLVPLSDPYEDDPSLEQFVREHWPKAFTR